MRFHEKPYKGNKTETIFEQLIIKDNNSINIMYLDLLIYVIHRNRVFCKDE